MTRRKRAITASINNLKRAKQFKEDHTQKPVEPEDDGEIVLWNDVLVEESRKKADNKDEDFDHCRLRHPGPHRGHPHLHCSDLRLRRKGFRGASIFSQFSIHCVLSGAPRWGNTFLPGLVGGPP
ncbi:hypothetical protein V8E54_002947 [Elaphomyces granulatus]